METKEAPTQEAPAKKTPKLPSLSPWKAPQLMCSNRECGEMMKPRVERIDRTGERSLVYRCHNCQYDFVINPEHANGTPYAIGKVGAGPKEVNGQ